MMKADAKIRTSAHQINIKIPSPKPQSRLCTIPVSQDALLCMLFKHTSILFLLWFLTSNASAQVWKYTDDQGVAHFTNEPVANGQLIIPAEHKTDATKPADLGLLPEDQARRTLNFVETRSTYKNTQAQLMAAAKTHGVDYDLVKAVTAAESAFNPNAVSHKGAVGLMQIMPATAAQYGVRSEHGITVVQKLKEPNINIQVGTRHLADLSRLYPDRLDLVLAAYNAGQGAVSRAGHQIPNYRETQNYVRKVLALYKLLQARS